MCFIVCVCRIEEFLVVAAQLFPEEVIVVFSE